MSTGTDLAAEILVCRSGDGEALRAAIAAVVDEFVADEVENLREPSDEGIFALSCMLSRAFDGIHYDHITHHAVSTKWSN